jgi:hypothetical protein
MANFGKPPFELGETLTGTDTNDTLVNYEWLGEIFEFPSQRLDVSTFRSAKTRYTGKPIKAIALRNVSGVALPPKRLAIVGTGYDSTHT